jgi:hypothetical protein
MMDGDMMGDEKPMKKHSKKMHAGTGKREQKIHGLMKKMKKKAGKKYAAKMDDEG